MTQKDEIIQELQDTINNLEIEIIELDRKLRSVKRKRKYAGCICFDFWPLKDWVRFYHKKWQPGYYWQLCIGPIRIDFWED